MSERKVINKKVVLTVVEVVVTVLVAILYFNDCKEINILMILLFGIIIFDLYRLTEMIIKKNK